MKVNYQKAGIILLYAMGVAVLVLQRKIDPWFVLAIVAITGINTANEMFGPKQKTNDKLENELIKLEIEKLRNAVSRLALAAGFQQVEK